ncbi:hypothetical protein NHX12_002606 [Muraenolepis orangiensis]|uniref:PHD finger protein 21A n=1 Tax=Muraenolepis orangiensis TaxID=630683 RepID=A0A9Q0DX15_9TELE|nr:hypothetical protein NHX12_002606 [Muraenolepis orangiensis]
MMELQILQEALKVEIQVHQKLVAQMKQDPQNADLKKQLHELQAKITALSEKQKKVVEQLRKEILVKQDPDTKLQVFSPPGGGDHKQSSPPGGGDKQSSLLTLTVTPVLTKTLPLVLKATPAVVLPQRSPSVTMVTTAISKSDSLNAPVNLQVKPANQIPEPVQATTNSSSSAQPIKVPQFVPPPRLTPRPSLQPQVRPKSIPCTNVPIAPAPPPMMAAPQLLQRPLMVAAKMAPSSATPIHQLRILNGQTPPATLTGIVITTSTRLNQAPPPSVTQPIGSPAPPPPGSTQPISSMHATKTAKLVGGREQKAVVSTLPLSPPPRQKREDNPQKLAFMVSLGLVTYDHLEEIQSRRQERKRRTTANPVYSGRPPKYSNPPELCRLTPTPPSSTAPEQPSPAPPAHTLPLPSPASGDCGVAPPTVSVAPPTVSVAPPAVSAAPPRILKKEEAIPWPGTLAIVHSYIAYKEAKEEEKQKLMKWSSELKVEREQLEHRVKQLSSSITKCMETKNNILARQKEMQLSLEKVKHLIRLIQAFNFNQAHLETDTSVLAAQVPAVPVPTAQVPAAPVPTAQVPAAPVPTAQVPAAPIPTAEVPAAPVPTAQVPAAPVPTAQVPAAPVPTAQVPAAPIPTVQVPIVQVPATHVLTTHIPAAKVPPTQDNVQVPTTEVPTTVVKPLVETETGVPSVEAPTAEVPTGKGKSGSATRREELEEDRDASSQIHREANPGQDPEKESPEVREATVVETKSVAAVSERAATTTTNGTARPVGHHVGSASRSEGKTTASGGSEAEVKDEVTNGNNSKTSTPRLQPLTDSLSTLDNKK